MYALACRDVRSDREGGARAVIFGITRFHQYIYRRECTIVSDHKPLQFLLSESRAISAMASARIQGWALHSLGSYHYHIHHKASRLQANVDALSQLLLDEPAMVEEPTQGVHTHDGGTGERLVQVMSDTISKQTKQRPSASQSEEHGCSWKLGCCRTLRGCTPVR